MSDSVVSQFGLTASDGENLAVVDWPLPEDQTPKAVVVLCHGLGEHIWRYRALAEALNSWGLAVRGLDWYGHGDSGGPRGGLPHSRRLHDDLADVVDDTARIHPGVPLLLLGHSMGGLIAADFVRRGVRPVDGLVLSSPALDPGLNWLQKLLLAVIPNIAPNLRVDNGLKTPYLCRDPQVVAAYKADRAVHRKICGRLALLIAQTGPAVVQAAAAWPTPTLLLYAGTDRLVNPAGSRAFAAAAMTDTANPVQARCFEDCYHELFNEPNRDEVLAALHTWLRGRHWA